MECKDMEEFAGNKKRVRMKNDSDETFPPEDKYSRLEPSLNA